MMITLDQELQPYDYMSFVVCAQFPDSMTNSVLTA